MVLDILLITKENFIIINKFGFVLLKQNNISFTIELIVQNACLL